ncbi:MAG: dienelactone hydrolase family protein [Acidobacteriota bacterium]
MRLCKVLLIPSLFALLAACAGEHSHTDRMAHEHANDEPVAADAQRAAGKVLDVESERVVYGQQGDLELSGYLARPAGSQPGEYPGLLVIHEWWGLNENIETMARMLAQEGYVALAVDLYGGEVAEDRDSARSLMQAAMTDSAAGEENLRLAHDFLESQWSVPTTGAIGWCFGGGWSLQAALLHPGELDAAIIYYGRLVTDEAILADLTTPILGLFGALDGGIPVAQVEAFEAALGKLGKAAEIHVYEDADHAFANPSGTRYQPEAARDAWYKALTFLKKNLAATG